jgi:hypothetical protein
VCDQLGHLPALSLDINHYHYQPPSPSRQPCGSAVNDAGHERHSFQLIRIFISVDTATVYRSKRLCCRVLRLPTYPSRASPSIAKTSYHTAPQPTASIIPYPRLRPPGMLTSMNNGSRGEDGPAAHTAHLTREAPSPLILRRLAISHPRKRVPTKAS